MGTMIDLKADDGHVLQAYLAEPMNQARGAVVVVQEIFGVNSHIRGVTDGYATDGYLAIAPALFDRVERGVESGYSQPEIQTGIGRMQNVSWDNATRDVEAAVDAVRRGGKVGIVGYCWGGAVAWVAAARVPELAAAVSYYGGAIPSLLEQRPRCPVLLHFGETDASIPVEKAREVAAAHPAATVHYYPAGHGFNCEQRASYDAAASALARRRTLEFFRTHLG